MEDIVVAHGYNATMPEGAAAALTAGTDADCGTGYNALNVSLAQVLPRGPMCVWLRAQEALRVVRVGRGPGAGGLRKAVSGRWERGVCTRVAPSRLEAQCCGGAPHGWCCAGRCCGSWCAVLHCAVQGLITEADVDTAVGHLLSVRFRLGMFDPPAVVPCVG